MTAKQMWNDLVVGNPMLIEIQRFRRRFLTFSGGNTMNSAGLALALVCYVGLSMIVFMAEGSIHPIVIVGLQTGLFTLFGPGMLHGAIAGERERRSWDLLLVAPITKAQIVAGKFIGALAALGVGALLFLFPIFIAAVTYKHRATMDLLLAEAVSLSFTVAVCALTILISARVRRPFMALGATLGTLGSVLIVAPLLLAMAIGPGDPTSSDLLYLLHPFYVISRIYTISEGMQGPETMVPASVWGLPQVAIYLFLAAVMVAWAANTLNFAENEVKFIPRAHQDA